MVEEMPQLSNILGKEASDLVQKEIDYLSEHKSQLSDEQLEKFDSVLRDSAPDEDGAKNPDEDGEESNKQT